MMDEPTKDSMNECARYAPYPSSPASHRIPHRTAPHFTSMISRLVSSQSFRPHDSPCGSRSLWAHGSSSSSPARSTSSPFAACAFPRPEFCPSPFGSSSWACVLCLVWYILFTYGEQQRSLCLVLHVGAPPPPHPPASFVPPSLPSFLTSLLPYFLFGWKWIDVSE